MGRAHGRFDQPGARPVVELPVRDAGGRAGRGAAVADVVGNRRHHALEQQPLPAGLGCGVAACVADPPSTSCAVSAHADPSVRWNSRTCDARTPGRAWSTQHAEQGSTTTPRRRPWRLSPASAVARSRPASTLATEILRRNVVEELAEPLHLVLTL